MPSPRVVTLTSGDRTGLDLAPGATLTMPEPGSLPGMRRPPWS